MIIPRIPYSLLGLKGQLTLAHRVLEVLESRHPGDALLQITVDRLQQSRTFAVAAVGASRKALTTKTVTIADDDRDESFESLKLLIRAGLKRSNPDFREKCERLYAILEKNGIGLARLPYDQETAALHALFADLDQPEAQADLTAINALPWYTELKTNQTKFEAAVQERGAERAEQDAPTIKEALNTLTPALKHIFKLLDVAEEGEMIADLEETMGRLNMLIAEVIHAYRRGNGSDDEEMEEPL